MVIDFTPKGTVLQVYIHNKNANAHGLGSGLAYLTESGAIWLDGHIYPVGASAYLYGDTYYPEPPEELKQKIESEIKDYVDILIRESEKIDRNAIVPESTDDFMSEMFGFECKFKDTSIRYSNLSGQEHNKRAYGEKIDSITLKHDPKAIHDAIFNEHLERHRFEIGGYLHLAKDQTLIPVQINAIKNYSLNGGMLGKTVIDALGLEGREED